MSWTTTTTTASDVAGVWLSELSAVLRGKRRQAVTLSHGEHQQQVGVAVRGEKAAVAAAKPAGHGKRTKEEASGGMSDATVYLLLDRFAPS